MLVKMENPNGGGEDNKLVIGSLPNDEFQWDGTSSSSTITVNLGFKPKRLWISAYNLNNKKNGNVYVYDEDKSTTTEWGTQGGGVAGNDFAMSNNNYFNQIYQITDSGFKLIRYSETHGSNNNITYIAEKP